MQPKFTTAGTVVPTRLPDFGKMIRIEKVTVFNIQNQTYDDRRNLGELP